MPQHFDITRYLSPFGMPPGSGTGSFDGLDPVGTFARRIAIVEDELMVAWSLETTVQDLGYPDVSIFADAKAALAGFRARACDLVLMDINLGGDIDGIETARRVREITDVRIIFISAYADRATRERIAQTVSGALFLPKPVLSDDLKAAIHRAFDTPN